MEKMDKELKSLPTIFDFHTEVLRRIAAFAPA